MPRHKIKISFKSNIFAGKFSEGQISPGGLDLDTLYEPRQLRSPRVPARRTDGAAPLECLLLLVLDGGVARVLIPVPPVAVGGRLEQQVTGVVSSVEQQLLHQPDRIRVVHIYHFCSAVRGSCRRDLPGPLAIELRGAGAARDGLGPRARVHAHYAHAPKWMECSGSWWSAVEWSEHVFAMANTIKMTCIWHGKYNKTDMYLPWQIQ